MVKRLRMVLSYDSNDCEGKTTPSIVAIDSCTLVGWYIDNRHENGNSYACSPTHATSGFSSKMETGILNFFFRLNGICSYKYIVFGAARWKTEGATLRFRSENCKFVDSNFKLIRVELHASAALARSTLTGKNALDRSRARDTLQAPLILGIATSHRRS